MTISMKRLMTMAALEMTASGKFEDMTKEQQDAYLKAHPGSKFNKGAIKKVAEPKHDTKPAAPAKPASVKSTKGKKTVAPKDAAPSKDKAPDVKTNEKPPVTKKAAKPKMPDIKDNAVTPAVKKKPGLMDTVKEMFGVKRGSYASVLKMVSAETAAAKLYQSLSAAERKAYLKANPRSRFSR